MVMNLSVPVIVVICFSSLQNLRVFVVFGSSIMASARTCIFFKWAVWMYFRYVCYFYSICECVCTNVIIFNYRESSVFTKWTMFAGIYYNFLWHVNSPFLCNEFAGYICCSSTCFCLSNLLDLLRLT